MSALCRPKSFPVRTTAHCPTCGTGQRMAGFLQLWYGQTITCLGCGDMWTDREMHPRPFKPRWRQENIAAAQKWWDKAEGYSDADRTAWIREQIDSPSVQGMVRADLQYIDEHDLAAAGLVPIDNAIEAAEG